MKPLQKNIHQRVDADERNTNQSESNWKKEWKLKDCLTIGKFATQYNLQ